MGKQRTATALSDWRTRRSAQALAYAALGTWLFTSTPGMAAINPADPFAGLQRVSDARLEHLRGGLRVQGYELRFGMRVQSSVSGVGEVVTELNWNEQHGWSPSSAYMQDAQGHGRRWDAADGQWKDAGPGAYGPIARDGNPGQASSGSQLSVTPAVTTHAPLAGAPAPVEVAGQGLGAVPQPLAATSLDVMPFEGSAPVELAQPASMLAAPAPPDTLAHSAGTGSPLPQTASADVAQSVAQNLAPPGSSLSSGQDDFELVLANTGTTQILHQITSGHVGALITNQQNDVVIDHRTEIDLTIANFTEVAGHAMHAIRTRAVVGSGVNRF